MTPFRDIEDRRRRARSTYRDVKKHYVRLNGWLPVFRECWGRRGDNLNYLTLCAKAAIDVRYFRQKGVLPYNDEQKIYPTLTFVERDAQDYAVIAEALGTTKLGIKGDLEAILVSPAQNAENAARLESSFPYDIINLDFTGEVVRAGDPPYSQTIRAIERIIQLQSESDCPLWHMFLTFRACRETSNHEADGELRAIIEGNLRNQRARTAYGTRPSPRDLRQQLYQEFLRIGMTKFLASSSSQRGYGCTLENSYIYPRSPREHGPSYHIVKLVVRFNAIRGSRNLPNPERARAAYENAVPQIFSSRPVDVNAALQTPATWLTTQNDLQPVLDELQEQGVVE